MVDTSKFERTTNYMFKAFIFDRLKKRKEEINIYDTIISMNPSNASMFHNRGNTYFKENDYTNAVKDLQKATSLKHYNFDFFHFLCWKYWFLSLPVLVALLTTISRFLFKIIQRKTSGS